ncbi:MAG TPA: T9SS type A sorting domain-containing protein [Saprospiraceae bacterium]|nr:T9SS type A sorting domain-containing protein [Saprospiraceae bacterium]
MKPSWVFIIMLYSVIAGRTQTTEQLVLHWASQFGGESAIIHDLTLDVNGNIYSIGEFNGTVDFDPGPNVFNLTSTGKEDVFITKMNAEGNLVWAKHMGGGEQEVGTALAIDQLGQLYITGYFDGLADFDPGNGVTNLLPIGRTDAFISKLDTNGIFYWALKVGGNEDDEAHDVGVDSNGDVVFTGLFNDSGDFDPGIGVATLNSTGDEDGFITKLDAGGIFVWAKRIGGAADDAIHAFDLNSDDEILATGRFSGVADFDPGVGTSNKTSAGKDDAFVLKIDVNGNFNWVKQFGSIDDDEGLSIHEDGGEILTTGYFNGTVDFDPGNSSFNLTSDGESDVFISKLTANGDLIWAKRFGGIDEDQATSITTDAGGNVYTTGTFSSTVDFDPNAGVANITAEGMINAFVSKLSATGEYIASGKLSTDQEIESNVVVVNDAMQIFVAGVFSGSGDFDPGPDEFLFTAVGEEDAFLISIEPCSPTTGSIDVSGCEVYTSPSGNHIWNTSGTYQDTIINIAGCDSILTINLTIHHSTEGEISAEACDEYMTPGGNFLTSSGIYTEVLTNAAGCDSVLVINLIILESPIIVLDVETCHSFVSPDGMEIWTASGIYYDTLANIVGCDSIIITNLTIDTVNTAVIYEPDVPTLTAEASNADYQWVDCNNGFQPIPGATEQSFTPTVNGSYAVIVSENDCSDTSACYFVGIIATKDIDDPGALHIYPNPAKDNVEVRLKDGFNAEELTIIDVHGREVYRQQCEGQYELSIHLNIVSGTYIVKMKSDDRYTIAKLIIAE